MRKKLIAKIDREREIGRMKERSTKSIIEPGSINFFLKRVKRTEVRERKGRKVLITFGGKQTSN